MRSVKVKRVTEGPREQEGSEEEWGETSRNWMGRWSRYADAARAPVLVLITKPTTEEILS
jgi:hypothetical protein